LNPPTEGSEASTNSNSSNSSNSRAVSATDVELRSSLDINDDDATVHDKSNVLLIGPTGSGKNNSNNYCE
jgi:ATP-dependent protease Clp ATPase subunit